MADSAIQIPEHWKLVTQKKKNGSQISVYKCQETGQQFYKYEDMMRYVNYAKKAKLGIYSPNFGQQCPALSKKGGRSVVGESGVGKSNVVDSDMEIPAMSSLELVPAEEKTAILDEQSGTEEDPERDMETDGSSTENNKFKLKYKRRKNKGKKH